MARKISGGLVGEPSVGAINVAPTAVVTAAENQDITLSPVGTGSVIFTNNAQFNAQADLRFADADSSNFVAFQAPATIPANYTLTLPSSVAASNNVALISDTNGTLTWATAGPALTDNNSDASTNYLVFTTLTSGNLTSSRIATTTRALSYQPSTGTLSTTLFNETSSAMLKENFRPIENALDKVSQLTGLIYDRKDGSNKDEVGLVAEDVNSVIPNIVGKDDKGNPATIAYQRLVVFLVESIKELKNEIEILKVEKR
jgi:hypothetical protein